MPGTHDAVFFDLGGTLFSYRAAFAGSRSLIFQAAERLEVDLEPREIGRAYRDASREAYARHGSQSYYLHRDLFRDTFRTFAGKLECEVDDAFVDWFEHTQREALIERMKPREDCLETLRALRERGLYTSIVSNIDDDHLLPLVDKWKLHEVLDHWTSSEEAQSCKPDPAFFELALAKAERSADRVLFVGDSPEHDIQGARRVGMTSVLIVEEGTTPPLQSGTVDVEPHHEIRSLSELLALVD